MSESNTTDNAKLSADGPIIELTENTLYIVGILILFFSPVLLIMYKLIRSEKKINKNCTVGFRTYLEKLL